METRCFLRSRNSRIMYHKHAVLIYCKGLILKQGGCEHKKNNVKDVELGILGFDVVSWN